MGVAPQLIGWARLLRYTPPFWQRVRTRVSPGGTELDERIVLKRSLFIGTKSRKTHFKKVKSHVANIIHERGEQWKGAMSERKRVQLKRSNIITSSSCWCSGGRCIETLMYRRTTHILTWSCKTRVYCTLKGSYCARWSFKWGSSYFSNNGIIKSVTVVGTIYLEKWTDYKSQFMSDLHPATQIDISRNTSLLPPSSRRWRKTVIYWVHWIQTALRWRNTLCFFFKYSPVRWRPLSGPSRRSCSTGSSPPGRPAARRLQSDCRGKKKGVGRLGDAPTCVCLMDQCRWWQLGQSAEIWACREPCTKGWCRWGVTRAAAAAASSSWLCLSVCLIQVWMFIYLIRLPVTWASQMLCLVWIGALEDKEGTYTNETNVHFITCKYFYMYTCKWAINNILHTIHYELSTTSKASRNSMLGVFIEGCWQFCSHRVKIQLACVFLCTASKCVCVFQRLD